MIIFKIKCPVYKEKCRYESGKKAYKTDIGG